MSRKSLIHGMAILLAGCVTAQSVLGYETRNVLFESEALAPEEGHFGPCTPKIRTAQAESQQRFRSRADLVEASGLNSEELAAFVRDISSQKLLELGFHPKDIDWLGVKIRRIEPELVLAPNEQIRITRNLLPYLGELLNPQTKHPAPLWLVRHWMGTAQKGPEALASELDTFIHGTTFQKRMKPRWELMESQMSFIGRIWSEFQTAGLIDPPNRIDSSLKDGEDFQSRFDLCQLPYQTIEALSLSPSIKETLAERKVHTVEILLVNYSMDSLMSLGFEWKDVQAITGQLLSIDPNLSLATSEIKRIARNLQSALSHIMGPLADHLMEAELVSQWQVAARKSSALLVRELCDFVETPPFRQFMTDNFHLEVWTPALVHQIYSDFEEAGLIGPVKRLLPINTKQRGFRVFESEALALNAFAGETPIESGKKTPRVMIPRIIALRQPHHRDRYQVARIHEIILGLIGKGAPQPSWTSAQQQIVDIIMTDPEHSEAEIARQIEKSPQNVNHHLDRIEALLKLEPVPERRVALREDREEAIKSLLGLPALEDKLAELNVSTIDDLLRGYSRDRLWTLGVTIYEMNVIDGKLKELKPPLSLAQTEPIRLARNARAYIRDLFGDRTAIPVTLERATGWVNAAAEGSEALVRVLTNFVSDEESFLGHLKSREKLSKLQRTLIERIRIDFETTGFAKMTGRSA